MIIALSGVKRSGKDTAAEGLIDRHKFVRIGLADKLKDICAKVFQVYRPDFDNQELKDQLLMFPHKISSTHIHSLFELLEDDGFVVTEDSWRAVCNEFMGKKLFSLREMLQVVGTDIIRKYVDDNVWLIYLEKAIAKIDKNVVITDARFANERKFVKDLGGVLFLIQRPSIESTDTHISENSLGSPEDYDVIINNKGGIIQLQSDIAMWYTLRRDGIRSKNK